MASTVSDARRRRIVERGSDRLAFITGQARALIPPSETDTDRSSLQDATCFDFPDLQEVKENISTISENISEITQELPPQEIANVSLKLEERSELKSDKSSPRSAFTVFPGTSSTTRTELQNLDALHRDSDSPTLKNLHFFTVKRLSESVSASEKVRLLFAVIVSLVVVFSFHGYSFGGITGAITFRPLYLILLTDATIVLGHSLLSGIRDSGEAWRRENQNSVDNIGQAVEAALLFQKAMRAFFMDCSICAVVMTCGLAI